MSQNNEDSSPIPAIKDEAKELLALAISTGTLVLSAVLMARGARNMSTIQPYANMNHWIKTTGMVTHTPYYQRVVAPTSARVYSETSGWVSRNVHHEEPKGALTRVKEFLLPSAPRNVASKAADDDDRIVRPRELPYAIFNFKYEFKRDLQREESVMMEIGTFEKLLYRNILSWNVRRVQKPKAAGGSRGVAAAMTVEGKDYLPLEEGQHRLESEAHAKEWCSRFAKGTPIDVYYFPLAPSQFSMVAPISEEIETRVRETLQEQRLRGAILLLFLISASFWISKSQQRMQAKMERIKSAENEERDDNSEAQ